MKVMLRHLGDWKVWEFASYVALNVITPPRYREMDSLLI